MYHCLFFEKKSQVLTLWIKDINCLFVNSQNPLTAKFGETTLASDAGTFAVP